MKRRLTRWQDYPVDVSPADRGGRGQLHMARNRTSYRALCGVWLPARPDPRRTGGWAGDVTCPRCRNLFRNLDLVELPRWMRYPPPVAVRAAPAAMPGQLPLFDPEQLAATVGRAEAQQAVPAGTARPRRVRWNRFMGPLPAGTRYVGRPSRWGNPFPVDRKAADRAAEHLRVCELFAGHLAAHPELVDQARHDLAGADLACGCGYELACHVDVWLTLLYGPPAG